MNQELGIADLILGASITVQLVMFILLLASVSSWYLIVRRLMLYRRMSDELVQVFIRLVVTRDDTFKATSTYIDQAIANQ